MRSFTDRIAMVTGAGGGIGRATAEALARRGCRLALVDIDQAALEGTAKVLTDEGHTASSHIADVTDADQMRSLAHEIATLHGACHILVNNAGVTSAGAFEDESLEDLRWIVDINMWGVVHGCRAFLPLLRQADEAHIVNLSSMVGLLGLPHNASYSLTKGAVRGFTEALRSELITTSIGVTAVFPGAIRTGITNTARGGEASRLAQMGNSRLAPLAMRPPDAVARRIVSAIEHDRARCVVGPDARLVDAFVRFAPGRSGLIGRLTSHFVEPESSRS
ncbi:SDR family NAD(P)-dependent oxidoreductase [soil metagenome]